jgi:hypothetical protein
MSLLHQGTVLAVISGFFFAGLPGAELVVPGTGIHLADPPGWQAKAPTPGSLWRWSNADHSAGIAVSSVPVVENVGVAQAGQQALKDLELLTGRFALIDWDFSFAVGGRTWSRLHFRHDFAESTWEQEIWFTVEARHQVIIALAAKPGIFAAARSDLLRALAPAGASGPTLVR